MAVLNNKLFFLASIFILGALASQAMARSAPHEAAMRLRHEQWMARYGRVYGSANEKEARYQIFKDNAALVDSFNVAGDKPYKLGTNQFADLTNEEFRATRNRFKGHMCSAQQGPFRGEDQGCSGGLMDDAFKFIIANKGLTTEANYPYSAADGSCSASKEGNHAATIKGYEDVPTNSESALLKAVANQPISVAIDAGDSSFQLYESGIFTGECGTELDHGVTAVGYGDSGGMKYWLIKNSWGTQWGEEGYIRMQRDIPAKEGICGIAMQASYPTA
ncbi:unnamed protein product [Linum tenue]|uniref:Uncharacterized protein n=1 Tax=Linum tenue TaxID=586396 RepID=A0AAV0LEU4_9ROSI|nr:unnamed protein product [Linum tenue]